MKRPGFGLACVLGLSAAALSCTSATNEPLLSENGGAGGTSGGAAGMDGGEAGAGGSTALVVTPSFLPTMVVDIDGRPKAYRLSWLGVSTGAPIPGTRIEFTTGFRVLGDEATPGEIYSEVWIVVPTDGAAGGAYSCAPAAGGTPVDVTWSYNHGGIGPNSRNFATSLFGGPCAVTLDAFGTTPGDRIKGSFSATLDGNHVLTNGVFDLVVPQTIPQPGQ